MSVRLALVITILGTLILGLFILMHPLHYIADDSYFYLTIARNIVNGHGSTFNQITPTNGYHPFWLIVCVLIFAIVGGGKSAAVFAVVATQMAFFVGMVALFWRVCIRSGFKFPIAGISILSVYFLSLGLIGSEAFLNGFFIVLASSCLLDVLERPEEPFSWIKLGATAGFMFLSRLDNVFLVGAFLLFSLLSVSNRVERRESAQRFVKKASWFIIPCLLVVSPYLLYNYLTYGHVVPISGAVKSSFPFPAPRFANIGWLGVFTGCVGAVSLAVSCILSEYRSVKFILRALGLGVVLHLMYVLVFTRFVVGSAFAWPCPWYWVAGVISASFLVSLLFQVCIDRSGISRKRALLMPIAITVLFILGIGKVAGVLEASPGFPMLTLAESLRSNVKSQAVSTRVSVARWMKSNLPPNSSVLVCDMAGVLAYFSDLKILAMDGLTADYKFIEDLRRKGIESLVRGYRVNYYLGPVRSGSTGTQTEAFFDPLHQTPVGALELHSNNLLKVTTGLGTSSDWAIWQIGQ